MIARVRTDILQDEHGAAVIRTGSGSNGSVEILPNKATVVMQYGQ